MNITKLEEAQAAFLERFPGGFAHPEMQAMAKKHKVDKMTALVQERFAKAKFKDTDGIVAAMAEVVSKSSVVSIFEKPRFKEFAGLMLPEDRKTLAGGLRAWLHGDREAGFEAVVDVLSAGRLAKWSLQTVVPMYFHPTSEVFLKPTTVKGVIEFFDLKVPPYKAAPSWEFYEAYRAAILDLQSRVDPSLRPGTAAFCGFLMMSMGGIGE